MTAPKPRRPFAAYLATQASWFFAFGLQTTLFPYVARELLQVDEALVGLAQTSLTAPALVLVLLAGVVAERLDRRLLLGVLHVGAVVPPLALSLFLQRDGLSYLALIVYGLAMGTLGALMMPTRDAALNAVAEASGRLTVQRAVVLTSLTQFASQIAGMLVASAGAFSGPGALTAVQAGALAVGALAALALPSLKPPARPAGVSFVSQLWEGLVIVWRSPLIRPMVAVMFSVGVFVIGGSFLVLLPVLVLDEYGGLSVLGVVLMTFWAGAALATVILARRRQVRRPGRALALTLALGSLTLIIMMIDLPFHLLLVMVATWGASGGFGIAMSRSIVQEAAPPEALGRVLSVYQLGFLGGAPVGALLVGVAAHAFGLKAAAVIPLVGVFATAVWLRFFTPIGRAGADAAARAPHT